MNKKTLSLAGLFILFSQVCIAGELIYSVKEYAKHGYVTPEPGPSPPIWRVYRCRVDR